MSVKSRRKGSQGEREVAKELFMHLGMTFKRDLRQYQQAEYGDLICENEDFPFSIEVKRHAKGWTCAPAWEVQAFKAAQNARKHPCVIYRFDGQQWRARIWFDALAESLGTTAVCGSKADLTLQDFAWVCRELMARRAA